MGKFKVGDRVRRVASSDWPERYGRMGQEYTVLGCECNGICVVEGQGSAGEENFELVAPALKIEAGKHYVTGHGERVGPMIKYGKDSWTGSPHSYLWNDDGQRYFKADRGVWDLVAEAPAPLQIEAGKSYKTRDGKKVTSISRNGSNGGVFYWSGVADLGGYGAFWCQNGSFYETGNHPLDLVAEWIDEPVAASNDNEPATPKFKVGDRVRFTNKCASYWFFGPHTEHQEGVIRSLDSSFGDYSVDVDGSSSFGWVNDEHIELAPASSPGKFKVGDRVVGTSCGGSPVDGVVIVADYDCPAHLPYLVQVTDGERWCSEAKLSLAPTTTTNQAIVALIENGQPKPSTRPHVHASVADAATEAKRLANKHKGQTFGVYELVDQKHVAKPTYEYEWQRLAADGERTQAEAIIRRLTGVTDWQARRLVSDWVRAAA